ncbi:MAG: hypothetical protein K2K09_06285, partial [Lachnospiraceae bacterium]|nr:hypothetical protein [Lachnospiraceae bacterium]
YYVFTDGTTMRFYAVVITYQIDYDHIVETKTDKYTYSYSAIPTEGKTANCDLTQADFTGANAFLTVLPCVYEGTDLVSGTKYRNKTALGESAGDVIEIKGDAMTVTFKGTGTIAITAKSTGGSNTSSIALRASDGSYVAATYTGSTAGTTDVANVYQVTGTTDVVFTFTVNVAGTYTICSLTSLYARNTRITGIVMTDTYVVE